MRKSDLCVTAGDAFDFPELQGFGLLFEGVYDPEFSINYHAMGEVFSVEGSATITPALRL